MVASLAHRGPDHREVWSDPSEGIALGHARLAVLDLSPAGNNPMARSNGRYRITYNGEVYNFLELRRELEAEGFAFASRSDSEVVLAAYERWGAACVARFVGMFAFAIWDGRDRTLFVARDRLGKKPLYYARYDGRVSFASEPRALLVDPGLPREVDPDALSLYLRFGYVPSPATIFRGILRLPPGHVGWLGREQVRVESYWDPLATAGGAPVDTGDTEAERSLEALLGEAVRQRTISDVPVGAFLSGGIDSSLVVALLQERSDRPVRTFSVRFEDPEFDESEAAARVAAHLGTEHQTVECGEAQMLPVVDGLGGLIDEPLADSSFIPTYVLSRAVRSSVTVAMTGDGGDEAFWGYPRYGALRRWGWLLGQPGPIRNLVGRIAGTRPEARWQRIASVLLLDDENPYHRFTRLAGAGEIRAWTGRGEPRPIHDEVLERLRGLPLPDAAPLLDLVTYLPDDVLQKVDRATMAAGLEARSPLLDRRVVEFAARLPAGLKWKDGHGKVLLRRMLARRLPPPLVDRPKRGFGVPLARWLKGPLRGAMSDVLRGPDLERAGVDRAVAERIWKDFLSGRLVRPDFIWALFVLASWSHSWLPAPPSSTPLEGGS